MNDLVYELRDMAGGSVIQLPSSSLSYDDPVTAAVWQSFLLATFGPTASVNEVALKRHDRPPEQPPSVSARVAAVVTLGAAAALIIATVVLVVCDLIRTRPG